jgi:hypothetical protein
MVAVLLSVIGGLLIVLSGILVLVIGTYGSIYGVNYPVIRIASLAIIGVGAWGVICGILVLTGSYVIYARPYAHTIWGAIVLIFSLLSFLDGAGFVAGGIFGIIGGVWAIFWTPEVADEAVFRQAT